ncbi:MAG: hypothetical protein NT121_07695 [Chloroflexi bacterium]|nr:hypothetical protein [Chloroflexota bacterium]
MQNPGEANRHTQPNSNEEGNGIKLNGKVCAQVAISAAAVGGIHTSRALIWGDMFKPIRLNKIHVIFMTSYSDIYAGKLRYSLQ